jgi:hypothetical protein
MASARCARTCSWARVTSTLCLGGERPGSCEISSAAIQAGAAKAVERALCSTASRTVNAGASNAVGVLFANLVQRAELRHFEPLQAHIVVAPRGWRRGWFNFQVHGEGASKHRRGTVVNRANFAHWLRVCA